MSEDFVLAIDEAELAEGKMKLVSVEGIPILFIKQHDKIYAVDNRCPHMGCGFSGGTLDGLCLICPCHDWCFNIETGEYKEDPAIKLKKYEWKIEEGKIWVKLDE